MAHNALAREGILSLRREIARIEGRLAERLELPSSPAPETPEAGGDSVDGDAGMVVRRRGIAAPLLLPLGIEALDCSLGGGLPLAAMTEIHGAQMRDAGAVAGFALGLAALALSLERLNGESARRPLLWIAGPGLFDEAGDPYAPGIAERFGIEPERLLICRTRRIEQALWVAEEAAALPELALVLLETAGSSRKLDLTATRRLHRRAQRSGRPLLLLRQAGATEPTAAPVRLQVGPAPAAERQLLSGTLEGSIGPPAFTVAITRSRTNMPASATLEWSDDARAFRAREPAARHARETGREADPGAVAAQPQDGSHPAAEMGSGLAAGRVGSRAA
jgi:protein ImuA